jgi:hypothetical protein
LETIGRVIADSCQPTLMVAGEWIAFQGGQPSVFHVEHERERELVGSFFDSCSDVR